MNSFKYCKSLIKKTAESIKNILGLMPDFYRRSYLGDRSFVVFSAGDNPIVNILISIYAAMHIIILLPPAMILTACFFTGVVGMSFLPVAFALDCGSMLLDACKNWFIVENKNTPHTKNSVADNCIVANESRNAGAKVVHPDVRQQTLLHSYLATANNTWDDQYQRHNEEGIVYGILVNDQSQPKVLDGYSYHKPGY